MSTGSRARSARSSGKAPPKKRAKKQKSEFKGHKKHVDSSKELNVEQVRTRVVDALDHLGRQKFSTEPGGYGLDNWLKSMKTLLDDFEDKVGEKSLTEEYNEKRKEVVEKFAKPIDTAKVDAEIEEVRKEETEIRAKIQEESERIAARLNAIGSDKVSRSKEVDEEKAKLQVAEAEKKSASFFSKLMGRRGQSTEPMEKRIAELEKGLKMLEEEALNLQAARKSLDGKPGEGGLHAGLPERLEALAAKMKELESARQLKVEVAEERQKAAEELSKAVAAIKLEAKQEE